VAGQAQSRDPGLTMEVSHSSVDAGGLRVHLAEVGDPADPAVLMLHGWPQTHREWRHVGPLVAAEGYRVLMPDLRGFGVTEVTDHGMDPETFARDQVALLDALGIERAFLVGHDWGGYTGFLLAARHPDRIRAYLACNTPQPWAKVTAKLATEMWRSWYAVVIGSPLGPELLRRTDLVKRALTSDTRGQGFTEADLEHFAAAFRPPERARAAQRLYRSYGRTVLDTIRGGGRSAVPPLRVPAKLLFGTRDKAISTELVRGFPGLELVPDVGHFIVDERPQLVVRRALDLFGSVD
jgi:pimeloyl-ACP methyl ester carboxylesterase